MTNTAPKLPTFEDHDVATAAVRITKCGDGLSEALKVEPKALQLGDRVSYVLTGVVSQINHKDNDGVVTRLHTVETLSISEVERELAEKLIAEEADRIERVKAERDGQMALQLEREAEERERSDMASTGSARSTQTSE